MLEVRDNATVPKGPLCSTLSVAQGSVWWLSLEVPSGVIFLGLVFQFKAAVEAQLTRERLLHYWGMETFLPQY